MAIKAAKAIIAFQGKMALILRDDNPKITSPNMWDAPGGLIEQGESPSEGIRRELAEEICISPHDVHEGDRVDYEDGSIVHRFFVKLSPDEYERVRLGDEGQCLEWFTCEEAMGLSLTPRMRRYFEKKEGAIRDFLVQS